MTELDKLKNIFLNENAYFYKNNSKIIITENRIKKTFVSASTSKKGNYLLNVRNQTYNIKGVNIKYSFCAFKYESKPSFIDQPVSEWEELKIAYLLIAEIEDFIVISKKNISGIQDFINLFTPLDYSILSSIFVDDDTQFEKFALKNMNVSNNAIRHKSIEAINLKENFSSLGANNYILNSLRLNNENEKISLSLNSSRINKFGRKNTIKSFLFWALELSEKIDSYTKHETFLSVFAEPQDYEKLKNKLNPIATLFTFTKLYEDFENNYIQNALIRYGKKDKIFDIVKHLHKIERLCQIESNKKRKDEFRIENQLSNDLFLKFNDKSISLRSTKLKNLILVKDNGREQNIIDYLNKTNQFLINFENLDFIYTNKKLFKDSKLLGSIDYFLKIFKPYPDLLQVTSEKGTFTKSSTKFSTNSVFDFVENEFMNDSNYFMCDDLGNEWADHIGITENKIMFIHSKYKEANFSASAFQDIVGQAQKNLGNLSPQDFQFKSKKDKWKKTVNIDSVKTKITRLRKGKSVHDAIKQFKETIKSPNPKREVYLAINFISKKDLQLKLSDLKNGNSFTERNQVIQILWFISSLISSCREVGTDVYICCKP